MSKSLVLQLPFALTAPLFPVSSIGQAMHVGNPPGNSQSIHLYENKQECMDKNNGPHVTPNDTIKAICDAIVYTESLKTGSGTKDDSPPQQQRGETEAERVMRNANEYYRQHKSEYDELHREKLMSESKSLEQEKKRLEQEMKRDEATKTCILRNTLYKYQFLASPPIFYHGKPYYGNRSEKQLDLKIDEGCRFSPRYDLEKDFRY